MTSRRSFLQNALLFAVAGPAALQVYAAEPGQYEYDGPDSADAFKAAIAERSANGVLVSVLHATWCGPCKSLFAQMDDIRRQPGIKIQLLGVDIDKYPKISKAMLPMVATPQSFFYIYGQPQAYKFAGTIRNVPEMMRYLRELTRAVHGDQPGVPRL